MKNSFVQILSAPKLITVVSVRKLHSAIQSIDVLKGDGFVNTCQPFGNSNRLWAYQKQLSLQRAPQLVHSRRYTANVANIEGISFFCVASWFVHAKCVSPVARLLILTAIVKTPWNSGRRDKYVNYHIKNASLVRLSKFILMWLQIGSIQCKSISRGTAKVYKFSDESIITFSTCEDSCMLVLLVKWKLVMLHISRLNIIVNNIVVIVILIITIITSLREDQLLHWYGH